MRWSPTLVVSVVLLAGCTPKLDPAEVKEMLLGPSRGVVGGVEIGDSWEKLKADHDKRYTVRDEQTSSGTFLQLRHDLGSPGEHGFFLTFQVGPDKKVQSYSVSIYGGKQNAVVVRQVLDDVIAHFDRKIGGGHCGRTPGGQGNSSSCDWTPKGNDPVVSLSYLEMSDPIHGMIDIEIRPQRTK